MANSFLGTDYPPAISMGVNVNSLKSHAACRRPAMSSGTLAKSGVLRFDYWIVDAAPAIKSNRHLLETMHLQRACL